jgi:hemin uptake protein HemP
MPLTRRPAPPSPPHTGTAASDSGAARGASDHAAQTHAVHSEVPCLDSERLLQGHGSVAISHRGVIYRLQATRQGKLILTK